MRKRWQCDRAPICVACIQMYKYLASRCTCTYSTLVYIHPDVSHLDVHYHADRDMCTKVSCTDNDILCDVCRFQLEASSPASQESLVAMATPDRRQVWLGSIPPELSEEGLIRFLGRHDIRPYKIILRPQDGQDSRYIMITYTSTYAYVSRTTSCRHLAFNTWIHTSLRKFVFMHLYI